MEELKTLEDINREITEKEHTLFHFEAFEILQQEAIKWVNRHSDKNMDCCWNKKAKECWGMGNDWIDFFNITEEDLK